jgi:tetratricopeptide (TPR) repeat protein
MSDFRVCGTALRDAEAIRAEHRFRAALRAMARGDSDRARALAPPDLAYRSPGSPACAQAAAYAYAMLQREIGAGSESDLEAKRAALLAEITQLDAAIADVRRQTSDATMWRCRSKVGRAQAALVLGDAAGAAALLEQAVAELSAIWGPDHLEVAAYLDDYATALFALGREAEATRSVERARAITTAHRFSYEGLD